MPNQQTVEFETFGNIAVITLNRPDQRNCVNAELSKELRAAVQKLENDPDLRVGILKGNGKVFCAGMDLKAFSDGDYHEILFDEGRFGGFVSLDRTKPIIAAIHGAAIAGGMELMLACDMVIAEKTAKFGLPEASLGLMAAAGGVFRLAERIPAVIARELVLTGKLFGTDDAEKWGLLNRAVDGGQAFDAAMELAQSIVRSAPKSIEQSLYLSRFIQLTLEEKIWDVNDRLMSEIITSEDAKEGALAFAEKRKPVWQSSRAG